MGQKVSGLPDVSSSLPALHTLPWSLLHVLISVSSTHLSAARPGVILLLPAPPLHLFLLCLSVLPVFLPPSLGSSSQSNSQEANRNTHTHKKKSRKRLISEIRRGWEQPWKSHIFSSHGICGLRVFLLSDTYRTENVFHSFKYHNSAVNVNHAQGQWIPELGQKVMSNCRLCKHVRTADSCMMSRLFVYFRCIIFSAPQLILKATILFWLKYTNLRSVWGLYICDFLIKCKLKLCQQGQQSNNTTCGVCVALMNPPVLNARWTILAFWWWTQSNV